MCYNLAHYALSQPPTQLYSFQMNSPSGDNSSELDLEFTLLERDCFYKCKSVRNGGDPHQEVLAACHLSPGTYTKAAHPTVAVICLVLPRLSSLHLAAQRVYFAESVLIRAERQPQPRRRLIALLLPLL